MTKDKHTTSGPTGAVTRSTLPPTISTALVSPNQDNPARSTAPARSNTSGRSSHSLPQMATPDLHETRKSKLGKKKVLVGTTKVQEEQLQDVNEFVVLILTLIGGEVILDTKLAETVTVLESYEKNCVSHEDRQKQEEVEWTCTATEHTYPATFCTVDKEIANYTRVEANKRTRSYSHKFKLTIGWSIWETINTLSCYPARNTLECPTHKKHHNGDNCVNPTKISPLCEPVDMDTVITKNPKADLLKMSTFTDEFENDSSDPYHFEDHVWEANSRLPFGDTIVTMISTR